MLESTSILLWHDLFEPIYISTSFPSHMAKCFYLIYFHLSHNALNHTGYDILLLFDICPLNNDFNFPIWLVELIS